VLTMLNALWYMKMREVHVLGTRGSTNEEKVEGTKRRKKMREVHVLGTRGSKPIHPLLVVLAYFFQ